MRRISGYLASVATAAAVLAAACGSASAAPLHWSAGRLIDASGGVQMDSPVCPSVSLCLSDDANQQIVEFDPATPGAIRRIPILAPALPSVLTCASTTQCTQMDVFGDAATFNPAAPPSTLRIDAFKGVIRAHSSLASPSDVTCPATTECVLVNDTGSVWGFDPNSSTSVVRATLDHSRDDDLQEVACPSASQCTAVSYTTEWTFDPAYPNSARSAKIEPRPGDPANDISCPAVTQCTTVGSGGDETTFNPQTGAVGATQPLTASTFNPFDDVECPSTVLCIAIGQGNVVSFDPQTGQPLASVAVPEIGTAVCPSVTMCVGNDREGDELVFQPGDATAPQSTPVDTGAPLLSLSCPGARQCTAVDGQQELTFDPLSVDLTTVHLGAIPGPPPSQLSAVACPTLTLCTASRGGNQISFNPGQFGNPARLPSQIWNAVALRCPSHVECVGIAGDDAEVYDPKSGRVAHQKVALNDTWGLTALACPSPSLCTATDGAGHVIAFDPRTGHQLVKAFIDPKVGIFGYSGPRGSAYDLDGVACPSTSVCFAVDTLGYVVQFDPRSSQRGHPYGLDSFAGLTAVACPSLGFCLLGDSSGRVWTGGTGGSAWRLTSIDNSAAVTAIDCVSDKECVAVNVAGEAFTAR